jgi:two-component system, cell cycle sensor histidine kinase and response regulator CckA
MIKEIIWFALSGSNVRSYFTIADDLMDVDVDKDQISQVLNNLALNAVQAMPDGGILKVSASNALLKKENPFSLEPGRYIRIAIDDQGLGIEPKNLPHVFDPFFTTRDSSSGMGSTTAWSIVKRHGGHIAVESEQGVGSVFEIYLPSSTSSETVGQVKTVDSVPPNMNILVMDDDDMVCDIAGHILTHLGHRAIFAADGDEAVKLFGAAINNGDPFDMVILDLTIPGGMGGKQAIVEIRQADPTVKALVASGYSNDPVLADCKHFGFDGVVTKPFNVDGLRQSMAQVYSGQ